MSKPRSVYREMLHSTGIYSVSVMAGRMSSFLFLPIYTRFLTTADYGVIELIEITLYVFGTFIGMRMGDALMFDLGKNTDPEARKRSTSTALLGGFAVSMLAGMVGWILAPQLSQLIFQTTAYATAFQLMFGSFVFSLPQEVGLSYMRALNRPQHYVITSMARLLASIVFNLLFLVVLRWGMIGILWGGVLSSAVVAAGIGVYCLRENGFHFRWNVFAGLCRYGGPLGVGGLGFLIIHYGDRYFLKSSHVSLNEIGVYSLAYKIGMLITYIQTPFDIYWRAQMFQIIRRPDGEQVYVRTCTYLALCLSTVVLAFALFSKAILNIIATPEFAVAAVYIPWIGAAYVIRTIGSHFRSVFLLEGKTVREASVVWAGALVCLAGYVFLIPRFKLAGAIAATGLAFVVMFGASLYRAQKVRPFPFEYRRLIMIAVSIALLWCGWEAVRPFGTVNQFALGSVFLLAFPLSLWWSGFFHRSEQEMLRAGFSRLWTWSTALVGAGSR